jgi:hypothetical protein
MSELLLSILIPTVKDRAHSFHKLKQYIYRQMVDHELTETVEILFLQDSKELSIGEKRSKLYRMAHGVYSWQIDDDDWLHPLALPYVVDELKGEDCDCVGFKELCIFDGKRVESSAFSLKYPGWLDNHDGFNHVRTPFFKTPIKTRLCLQAPIPPIRFGEDHAFAKNIYPLLERENYIDEFIYHYRHNSTPHNERYGIAQ